MKSFTKASEELTKAMDAVRKKLDGASGDKVSDTKTRKTMSEAITQGKKAQTDNVVTCDVVEVARSVDMPQSDSSQSHTIQEDWDTPIAIDCVDEWDAATKALNDASRKTTDATLAVQNSIDTRVAADNAAAEAVVAEAAQAE